MNFFDPDDYLFERGLTDFPLLPPISLKLRNFLDSSVTDSCEDTNSRPTNDRSSVNQLCGRKRSSADSPAVTLCISEAKVICRRLLLDADEEMELVDEDLHPKVMKRQRELNYRRLQKLQFQKNILHEELSKLREEHEEDVKQLGEQFETRKKKLLSEMQTQLESQKIRILQLKGSSSSVKNTAATLNASVNNSDNSATQVVTRKLRKRANAEAAALGGKSSTNVDSSVSTLLNEQNFLNETCNAVTVVEHNDVISNEGGGIGSISGLMGEEDGSGVAEYGEMPRIKGTGNSIAITGNGYRVDSLLAKLDIKLPEDEIMNDLLIITQGKYTSSSAGSNGSYSQVQGTTSTKIVNSNAQSNCGTSCSVNESQRGNNPPSVESLSFGHGASTQNRNVSSNNKTNAAFSVYIEDKNLVYNSMTFCKGQQVYIEGQMRGNFTILTINQTEIQLRKINDSTKIKISLDMLRRGAYKLILR